MMIQTKVLSIDFQIHSPNIFGNNKIRPSDKAIVKFCRGHDIISIETSEDSRLYDDLSQIVGKAGKDADFYFDFLGEPVKTHFEDKIIHLNEVINTYKIRLNKERDLITDLEINLSFIQSKWWYKLFTYFTKKAPAPTEASN